MGNFVIPKTTSSPTVPAGGTFGQILAKTNEFDFNTQWIDNTDLVGFTLPTLTSGSVLFSNGTTIAQDNSNFFWDNTNKRLRVGTNTPANANGRAYLVGDVNNYPLILTDKTQTYGLTYQVNGTTFNIFSDYYTGSTTPSLGFGTFSNKNMLFLNSIGNILINSTTDNGGKLQIKASGAASTDIALRIRNSGDTADLISVAGNGVLTVGGTGSDGTINLARSTNGAVVGAIIQTASITQIHNYQGSGIDFYVAAASNLQRAFVRSTGFGITGTTGGTFTLDASAALQINSTTQGVLAPRLTTVQRDAIVTPATGLQIYNTTLNTEDFYNGTSWNRFGTQTLIRAGGGAVTDIPLRVRNSGDTTDLFAVFGNNTTVIGNSYGATKFSSGSFGYLSVGIAGEPIVSLVSNVQSSTQTLNGVTIPIQSSNLVFTSAYSYDVGNDYNIISVGKFGIKVGNTTSAIQILSNGNIGLRIAAPVAVFQVKTTTANTNGSIAFLNNNSVATIGAITDTGSALTMLQFRADGINFTDLGTNGIVIASTGYALSANATAILDVRSTTKGFLPPRMTTAQKVGIATPATGLVVFDTDLGKLCVFAVTWQTITSV